MNVNARFDLIKKTYSYTEMSMSGQKVEYTADAAKIDFAGISPRERHRLKRITQLHTNNTK